MQERRLIGQEAEFERVLRTQEPPFHGKDLKCKQTVNHSFYFANSSRRLCRHYNAVVSVNLLKLCSMLLTFLSMLVSVF